MCYNQENKRQSTLTNCPVILQVQVTAVGGLVVPMEDQRGTHHVPIALRPDFTYFDRMTQLANELRPAEAHVNPPIAQKKERRLTLEQSQWEGCDKTAQFFQLQQKSWGKSTLASALLEGLGSGKVLNDIAEVHKSTTRKLTVSLDNDHKASQMHILHLLQRHVYNYIIAVVYIYGELFLWHCLAG